MEVTTWQECEGRKVETINFKGEPQDVKGVTIRWLSKCGQDATGAPQYGLRHFTVEPGGEIPIHDHFYHQTTYILTGEFECWTFDPETGEKVETAICGPGTATYSPSMVPHGMKNTSDTEPATFLCCIGSIYGEDHG